MGEVRNLLISQKIVFEALDEYFQIMVWDRGVLCSLVL